MEEYPAILVDHSSEEIPTLENTSYHHARAQDHAPSLTLQGTSADSVDTTNA